MYIFKGKYECINWKESGWPFDFIAAHELKLTNCRDLVIPAAFQVRDKIIIKQDGLKVTVVFDGAILVMIKGRQIPHTIADQYVGKRLSDAVKISQLRQHPVSSMVIHTLDLIKDGMDIELR